MASRELEVAREAALAAAEVIRPYFRNRVAIRIKPDASPVTEADVRAEETIRSVISRAFPSHGFYGEETGRHAMDAESIWIVDPIDGTKSFVRDSTFFSTQIALMRQGKLVLGVSMASEYGELAWAEAGQGAWLDGKRVQVRPVAQIADAFVSLGNHKWLTHEPQWGRVGELARSCWRFRGYGDFIHYHMLACGSLDVVIESDLNILDIAALTVIVREAGGVMTDLQGREIGLETRSVLAASNAGLHAAVKGMLGT